MKSGANDVVVVKQPDGSLKSTPFQITVGKMSNHWTFIYSREGKTGNLFVNGVHVLSKEVTFKIEGEGQVMIYDNVQDTSCDTTSENLQKMNLKEGRNEAKMVFDDFSLTQPFDIYFYDQTKKLIITDIDGTITKSDIIGNLAKVFKFDYHHKGVVELFDSVSKNGYVMIYLTANPQAFDELTKEYLFETMQDRDGYSLPLSPVIMSPTVILNGQTQDKAGNKLASLQSLLNLFDLKAKVVEGAYGNKDTDTKAYLDSGINPNKVFW